MIAARGIRIAIDGPAGAGKSTIARLLAGKLGYIYVDTGAMYRAVTLQALRRGISPADDRQIGELMRELDLRLEPGETVQRVYMNGEDVTGAIRSVEVTANVSAVAAIPSVRSALVALQQTMASEGGIVMDGRDIGSTVLPQAEVKIYLTASADERARRRLLEIDAASGMTLERLRAEIERRDELDRTRIESPLTIADGAVVLDCTDLEIGQVVDRIYELCLTAAGGER